MNTDIEKNKTKIVEYYKINTSHGLAYNSSLLEDRNFEALDLAISVAKNNPPIQKDQFFPSNSIDFKGLTIIKKEKVKKEAERPIFYKSGPRKGQIKKTYKETYDDFEYTQICNYEEFNCIRYDFETSCRNYWTQKKHKGFYEVKVGGIDVSIESRDKETSVNFKSPYMVRFIECERIYSPEIKEAGLPYSPAKEEFKEGAVSDWMPVFYISHWDGSSDGYYIDPNISQFLRATEQYFYHSSYTIYKKEIEIEIE